MCSMVLPKLIKLRTFNVPPKSTNNLYFHLGKGRLVKSYSYKLFREIMKRIIDGNDGFLPDDMNGFGLYVEVGVCKEFDLDNTLKGVIDALQEAYRFNDNQINMLLAKKVVIGNYPLTKHEKLKQYVRVGLFELSNQALAPLDSDSLKDLNEPEDYLRPTPTESALLLNSTSADQVEIGETASGSMQYLEVTLDLENAVEKLELIGGVPALVNVLRETKKDQYLIKNAAEKLGVDVNSFRDAIHNRLTADDLEEKLGVLGILDNR